jgi:hypothetical protein
MPFVYRCKPFLDFHIGTEIVLLEASRLLTTPLGAKSVASWLVELAGSCEDGRKKLRG